MQALYILPDVVLALAQKPSVQRRAPPNRRRLFTHYPSALFVGSQSFEKLACSDKEVSPSAAGIRLAALHQSRCLLLCNSSFPYVPQPIN